MTPNNKTFSNVVKKDTLRKVQINTLNELSNALINSFGPYGSTSIIKDGDSAATVYTKDGHDILRRIKYNGPIECTIVDDLVEITRHVVKTVGDGTTSAVEIASLMFNEIYKLEHDGYTSRDIADAVNRAVEMISEKVYAKRRDCTIEDIFDLCMTSTNGNERLSGNITQLYREFGDNTYIDLEVSVSSTEDVIKTYEGMVLPCGYTDHIFANTDDNTCELVNPSIYVFEDPIDTPEMIALFDKIIHTNILSAYSAGSNGAVHPIPTVIIAPKISNDMSSMFSTITQLMARYKGIHKPPIVVLSSYYNMDEMSDIATMCNAPMIHKYINPEIQEQDIANGMAPSIENVEKFCGQCGKIVVDSESSKFIDPILMYDEEGNHTPQYESLYNWLATELKKAEDNGETADKKYKLRKRLNSLGANLVEYFVGGVSIADRDNDRALLEDAIKNCRSAMANGVGYGANAMAYTVLDEIVCNMSDDEPELMRRIMNAFLEVYDEAISSLYRTAGFDEETINNICETIPSKGPMNLRTHEYDGRVLSSIMADIEILKAVSKIVVLMATSNQFILPGPQFNIYEAMND